MAHMACDVAVMCADLGASARFYTALGANLGVEDGGDDADYFFGQISSLLLTLVPAAKPDVVTRNLYWGVEVPCLFEVWTRLDEAGFGETYQLHMCETQVYMVAFDPDGNRVTVRERQRRC